jgi:hypothetical protein
MCDYLDFEENSKKLREFQREKRQELQLIISRCNEIGFNYICVPKEKSKLCFGTTRERTCPIIPVKGSTMNSFMRKVTKEFFTEPEYLSLPQKASEEDQAAAKEKFKPSYIFLSKVPRFQDPPMTASGRRRRRKIEKKLSIQELQKICFGASKDRDYLLEKVPNPNVNDIPGVGTYNSKSGTERALKAHSFGGKITILYKIQIFCNPINNEICCACKTLPLNIYWKNGNRTLCEDCLSKEITEVKRKSKTNLERLRKLEPFKCFEVN